MRSIMLGVALAMGLSSQSVAQSFVRFQPYLTLDEDTEICGAYLSAWRRLYGSDAPLQLSALDFEAAFPQAVILPIPEPSEDGRHVSLYEHTSTHDIDFDGDGVDEVLYVQSDDIGWRLVGVDLYLFPSRAALDAASASEVHRDSRGRFDLPGVPGPDAGYRHVMRLPGYASFRLVSFEGAAFLQIGPQNGRKDYDMVRLVRLNGSGAPRDVCAVKVDATADAFLEMVDEYRFFEALADFYGSESNAWRGTQGWTAQPYASWFQSLIMRPWILEGEFENDPEALARHHAAREISLLAWAIEDPQSWTDYLELKGAEPALQADLARFYGEAFGYDAALAANLAWRAVQKMVETTISMRYAAGGPLDAPSAYHGVPTAAMGPFSDAESLPPDIAVMRLRQALSLEVTEHARARLLMGLYAGLPAEAVEDELVLFLSRLEAADRMATPAEQARAARERDELFLAALGRPDLLSIMVASGADVDGRTGLLAKTPLMYAAQQNDLASVRWLVEHDVRLNARTQADTLRLRVDRDHRTALMYAAENGSAALITYLVERGADTEARDSAGHTAIWYLARNESLADPLVRARLEQILAPAE